MSQLHQQEVWRSVTKEVRRGCGVYPKDACSIPAGMGKYIPVQTSRDIKEEVLIEASNKTIPGLILPDIAYSIFVENH